MHFSWNAFISAPDYFGALYPGLPIIALFGPVNSIPNLLSLFVLILIGAKIPLKLKIIPAYIVSCAVLIFVPVMGFIGITGTLGVILTVVSVAITAVCTALLQGGIFAFAGLFPPRYIQATMTGNAVAGIAVNLIRIVTKLTLPNDPKDPNMRNLKLSSSIFFFFSAGMLIFCIVSFLLMLPMRFVKYYSRASATSETASLLKNEGAPLQPDSSGVVESVNAEMDDSKPKPAVSAFAVFRKIWVHCVFVCTVFVVTLSIFPGMSSSIPSKVGLGDWLPIIITVYKIVTNYCRPLSMCLTFWADLHHVLLSFLTRRQLAFPSF